jgi:hypothetical protein
MGILIIAFILLAISVPNFMKGTNDSKFVSDIIALILLVLFIGSCTGC